MPATAGRKGRGCVSHHIDRCACLSVCVRLSWWDHYIPAAVTGRSWRTWFTCRCPRQRWHCCRNHTSV